MADPDTLQRLVDRQEIVDTIYRYASSNDAKDYATLRSTFADDAVARYAGAAPIEGADAIVAWIKEMCADKAWQHHLLNVYHVDFDGPDAARTLVYHTSHQTTHERPDTVMVIIARYTHRVRRTGAGWRIAHLEMTVGWMEEREFSQSQMALTEAQHNSAARHRSVAGKE